MGYADVWAAGAVGFVRGVGEWWLQHRTDPEAPSREVLTERVTSWLWTGPVSGLARTRPDSSPTGGETTSETTSQTTSETTSETTSQTTSETTS